MKTIICDVCGSPISGIRRHKLKTRFKSGDKMISDICGHCWDDIESEIIKRRKQKNENNN